MSLDADVIKKIAKLAHLEYNTDEFTSMSADLTKILEYINNISSLNTDDVAPLQHPLAGQQQRLRADEVTKLTNKVVSLKLAPEADEDFFVVPQVIEQKGK